ncbi:MAG: signal peptidase II [Blastocatellia bacterium]
MDHKRTYFILALLVLIADQVTKAWATAKLQLVDTMEILPNFFRLTYARNRGVAFSLFADSQFETKWILAGISTIAAVGVGYYLVRSAANSRRLNLALSFLLAGIVGNLIDRVRLGEVVDFIDFHWYEKYTWPTFNIADASICIGAVLLALEMLREEKVSQAQTTEG